MEKMPYQPHLDVAAAVTTTLPRQAPSAQPNDWRTGLPALTGSLIVLRELQVSDAAALCEALTTEEVARFISPPPTTVEGFEKFIAWTICQRELGQYVCFAIVPRGSDRAVGLFQVRALDPDFTSAEWGFAIAYEYWGTGIFVDGAALVVDFAFQVVGARRLEARAALKNGRGNGALQKIGAVLEAVLRRSFHRHGEYLDQALWTILAEDWLGAKAVWGPRVVH
jgi:ribosomal-protein-alanine N-acetyltransferase